MTTTSLLPQIDSEEFKQLHFKEQLYILNLYYHDKLKYLELCGLPPDELKYVDESIETILKISQEPEDNFAQPISFVENHWCAYLCYYNPKWWEEGFSPVDDLGYSHRRIFGIQLFNFPLVSLDHAAAKALRYLAKEPKKTRELNDVFYYTAKMRSAWQYFRDDEDPETDPVDIWNLSVVHLNDYVSISDLNGAYPVLEDSPLVDLIEEDVLVPLFSQIRGVRSGGLGTGRYYMPLIPSELYIKSQFKIRGWDFLTSKR